MSVFVTVQGVRLVGDVPDRWFEGDTKFRCPRGHVSLRYLKSETRGDLCLGSCGLPVLRTFPEDTEGNLLGAEIFAVRWYHLTNQERRAV